MGMKAAISEVDWARPGHSSLWRALRRVVTVAARVVLPEPGMPLMAIMRRADRGVSLYFPMRAVSGWIEWKCGMRRGGAHPILLDESVDLLLHSG